MFINLRQLGDDLNQSIASRVPTGGRNVVF